MSSAEIATAPGVLANRGIRIRMLQEAISQAGSNQKSLPRLFCWVLGEGSWREFTTADGHKFDWKPAEFRRFLEAPRPAGCQTSHAIMERILRDTEAWEPFQEAIRGKPGGDNNPCPVQDSITGKFAPTVNRDDITVDGPPIEDGPVTIPLDPEVPRPRQRDYAREAPTGTSVSYTFRRLSKVAPELAERVKAGELTCNAAAVQAGFREGKITVPHDPERAARLLVKHLEPAAVRALTVALAASLGLRIEGQ